MDRAVFYNPTLLSLIGQLFIFKLWKRGDWREDKTKREPLFYQTNLSCGNGIQNVRIGYSTLTPVGKFYYPIFPDFYLFSDMEIETTKKMEMLRLSVAYIAVKDMEIRFRSNTTYSHVERASKRLAKMK